MDSLILLLIIAVVVVVALVAFDFFFVKTGKDDTKVFDRNATEDDVTITSSFEEVPQTQENQAVSDTENK